MITNISEEPAASNFKVEDSRGEILLGWKIRGGNKGQEIESLLSWQFETRNRKGHFRSLYMKCRVSKPKRPQSKYWPGIHKISGSRFGQYRLSWLWSLLAATIFISKLLGVIKSERNHHYFMLFLSLL